MKIQEAFKNRSITIIPVKGAYLIPNIYKDFSIRYSGDIDFLVKHEDIQFINEVMNELGYNRGYYNSSTKMIEKISRAEEIKWKTHMSNLPPYFKLSNQDAFSYYKIDFRYALDDTLNKEPVNEIINTTVNNGYTLYSHYLIHLCTHFYDEAKHTATIAAFKDLNLIKLCDIREYLLHISNEDLRQTIDFALKYKLEKALYYTIYCMNVVYNEKIADTIIDELKISDNSFMNLFGENTKDEKYNFAKSFWQRFFSCGNYDELLNIPKHFKSFD